MAYDKDLQQATPRVYGIKGFDKDLKCRDFQYQIGSKYTLKDKPRLCSKGFHYCDTIKEVYNYYPTYKSRYCVVIAEGFIEKEFDKSCCSEITILRELSVEEIRVLETGINIFFVKGMIDKGYVIGGSLGLKMQGLDLKRPISDIDFITDKKDHEVCEDVINLQETVSNSMKHMGKAGTDDLIKCYMDQAYGTKYDILKTNKIIPKTVKYYGMDFIVQDAVQILNYKAKYAYQGSKKHYNDLKRLNVRVTFNVELGCSSSAPDVTIQDDLPF